jgi:dTDP-4-amino-4,6-dideoxygalactose transaminase
MEAINEISLQNDLLVIEDAAQSHGAFFRKSKVKSSKRECQAYSFYPENLGQQRWGAIATNDSE